MKYYKIVAFQFVYVIASTEHNNGLEKKNVLLVCYSLMHTFHNELNMFCSFTLF